MVRRKNAVVLFLVSFLCFSQIQGAVINSSWIGGTENEWSQPENWDPNIIPDNDANTFNVTIDPAGDFADVGLTQSRVINRLDCYGEVELSSWTLGWISLTLTDSNGITNYGELDIDEGFEIIGNITNSDSCRMELWNVEIVGNILNEPNAFMEVGGQEVLIEGDFTNNGWLFVSPECTFFGVEEGSFTNNGVFHIQNSIFEVDETDSNFVNTETASVIGSGTIFTENSFVNNGKLNPSAGCLKIQVHREFNNNDTGEILTTPGSSLYIANAFLDQPETALNRGSIVINPESSVVFRKSGMFDAVIPEDYPLTNKGTIELLGGTLSAGHITQTADANLTGFGSILGDIDIETGGSVSLRGATNIIGDVNIPATAELQISDGQTLITGFTSCEGTIKLNGGTVIFQGGSDCENCDIINTPGDDRSVLDFNKDGTQDIQDFAIFADNWLWKASWY